MYVSQFLGRSGGSLALVINQERSSRLRLIKERVSATRCLTKCKSCLAACMPVFRVPFHGISEIRPDFGEDWDGERGGPWRAEAGPEKSLPNATGLLSLFFFFCFFVFFSMYFFLFLSIYHNYLGRVMYTPAHDFFSAAATAVRIPHAPLSIFLAVSPRFPIFLSPHCPLFGFPASLLLSASAMAIPFFSVTLRIKNIQTQRKAPEVGPEVSPAE